MGEAAEKLSGKLGLDTTDFKTGLQAANRELRVLESGFKASAAALGDWGRSADGLEMRVKSLTSQIDVQKLKVAALAEEHKRLVEANGENSRAAQDAEIKLNKETERLNQMDRELKDTSTSLDKMRKESEDAAKGVDKLDDKQKAATGSSVRLGASLTTLGNGLRTVTNGLVTMTRTVIATTAAIGALTIGLVTLTVGPASDLAETTSKVEVVFGDAADEVLRFGENSDTAFGLSENAALSAAGTYGNLLRAIGLTEEKSADMSVELVKLAADLASFNNLKPEEVLDKLRAGLTGEAEPLKVLGINMNAARLETKALELGLIKQGEELTAAAKAQAAYAIMMEDTALAQGDFARTSEGRANQMRILAAQIENVKATIGNGFLPVVTLGTQVLNTFLQSATFTEGLEGFTGWIERLGNILALGFGENADLAAMGGELKTFLTDLISLGGEMATNILTGISDALPGILGMGSEILKLLLETLIDNLPLLLNIGIEIILWLVDAIVQNAPMLFEAALQAIITLANGLSAAAPSLIPSIVEAMVLIVKTLIDNLPLLITAALALIVALAQGIAAAAPQLRELLGPELTWQIIGAILSMIPAILVAGAQVLIALAEGMISLIPEKTLAIGSQFIENLLFQAVMWNIKAMAMGVELLNNIIKGVKDLPNKAKEIGKNFIDGLINGIKSAAGALYDAVSDIVNGMLDTVTGTDGLDQQSPSKKGRAIGANFTNSLAIGGQEALRNVIQSYIGMTGQLAAATATGISGGAGAVSTSSVNSEYNAYYAPVTVVSSKQVNAAEDAAKGRRF